MGTITRGNEYLTDRYKYDFRLCTPDKGWAQLDTRQDASYYGNWINPIELKLFSYCEGDITLTECSDEKDFTEELARCIDWHKQAGYFIGVDPMGRDEISEAFIKLGFGELLH